MALFPNPCSRQRQALNIRRARPEKAKPRKGPEKAGGLKKAQKRPRGPEKAAEKVRKPKNGPEEAGSPEKAGKRPKKPEKAREPRKA